MRPVRSWVTSPARTSTWMGRDTAWSEMSKGSASSDTRRSRPSSRRRMARRTGSASAAKTRSRVAGSGSSGVGSEAAIENRSTLMLIVKHAVDYRSTSGKRGGLAVALLTFALMAADARGAPRDDVPLPRPRPTDLHVPKASPAEEGKGDAHEKPNRDEGCLDRLKAAGFTFEPATQHAASNPACLIDTPVKLMGVPVASRLGASVRLPEEPMLACRFAERLGHFIGDLAAPVIAGRLSFELKGVRTGPGYECRNRNRAAGGHISAHAFGIAIDVASF